MGDPGLCCGSASTYSNLQPALSRPMLRAKVDALEAGHPDLIAPADIGCYLATPGGPCAGSTLGPSLLV